MEKINIAELLKDCPKGMALYSPIFGEVYLDKIRPHLAIVVTTDKEQGDFKEEFLYDGRYGMKGECMLFPSKGKTTWEGFMPPFKFKDGDIIAMENECGIHIFIYNYTTNEYNGYGYYVIFTGLGNFKINGFCGGSTYRLATEDEKVELFGAIKDNGYKWNPETKTLEKLIEPKFKVGDRVIRTATHETHIIGHITSSGYVFKNEGGTGFVFEDEHLYELVPDKFEITTLKPFESRVLVRDKNTDEQRGHFFSHYDNNSDRPYICIGLEGINEYNQCIPYEENKYLLGKIDDCDEFYKTWK